MSDVLIAIAYGGAFGFCLQRAGLTHYERIVNVFRLLDLRVLRFMLSALTVGAIGVQLGVSSGLVAHAPLPMTAIAANLVGGLVFGIGMASAGYCPGTVVAEAGEGRADAWIAGLSGLLVGALLYGLLSPYFMPQLARFGTFGHVSFAVLCGANPWLVLLVFVQLATLTLRLTARVGAVRRAADT